MTNETTQNVDPDAWKSRMNEVCAILLYLYREPFQNEI